MNRKQPWCPQRVCLDFGKVAAENIKVYSYVEQRLYCTTCRHTFSADTGTFFETIRTDRERVLAALELLTERNSLRAVERLDHCPHNTLLHWLDLAGSHVTAVSRELIHDLHISQAQIDELWTFVKKSRHTCNPLIPPVGETRGFGERSRCPVGCVSSAISAMSAAKPTRLHF